MSNSLNDPRSSEPDEAEVNAAVAEEREEKYGGGSRWEYLIFFILLAPSSVWAVRHKELYALFLVPVGILCGALAVINWRSWLKKTPAQRAAIGVDQSATIATEKFSARHKTRIRERYPRGQRNLGDVLVLMACPTAALFGLGWNRFDTGMKILFTIMALMIGGVLYVFPKKFDKEDSSAPDNDSSQVHFGLFLLAPIALTVALLYLVWAHVVLDGVGLAVFSVLVPAAIVATSYGMVTHAGREIKRTGKHAPESLLWTVIGFWVLATFIFVVCLVSLIQKFVLKW